MTRLRLLGSAFLVVEALVTAGIWVLLWIDPARGRWFLPPDVPPALISTFVAADLALFVATPLAAGHALFHRLRWARAALWFHAGGVAYATLWIAWQAVATGAGTVGLALMVPVAVIVPWLAWRVPAEGA